MTPARGPAVRRTAATVVVVAPPGSWPARDAVLDAVRSSLGSHDDLLVAGGGTPPVPSSWRPLAAPAGDVVAALVAVADVPTADVVVALHAATPLDRGTLDVVVAAVAGGTAVAGGPERSARPRPAAGDRPRSRLRPGGRRHRAGRRAGAMTLVDALGPGCIAVRDDVLAAVAPGLRAGRSTFDDLLLALRGRGPLVGPEAAGAVGPGPQGGAAPVPLVSACLITKDEEADLGGCLDSLVGLADQVVVYDTGSSDATVQVARRAGATVIEGHWDDDFARARNAALEACHGTWIVHLDADERLRGDHEGLRRVLVASSADGFALEIADRDADGDVAGRHRAVRVFRRGRGGWAGRLHEQVVPLPGQPPLVVGPTGVMGIDHHGDAAAAVAVRGKRARNVRLAEAGITGADGADHAARLLDLARALTDARRHDEAMARFEEARCLSANPDVRRGVLWQGAELLLVLGRPGEALRWVEQLRDVDPGDDIASFLEAAAHLQLGDARGSLSALDGVEDLWAGDGSVALSADLAGHQAAARLLAAERWEEAADALDSLLAERPQLPLWGAWARASWRAGRPVRDVADAVPEDQLRGALTQVLLVDDEVADAVGEHLWGRIPGDPRLVAYGTRLGPRLRAERALDWSARVRTAGLADRCPLIARAGRIGLDPVERVRAAATAAGAFGDPRAEGAVVRAAPHVPDVALADVLLELVQLAPQLLHAFVGAAATVPVRRAAIADALDALGAHDGAGTLRATAAGA